MIAWNEKMIAWNEMYHLWKASQDVHYGILSEGAYEVHFCWKKTLDSVGM